MSGTETERKFLVHKEGTPWRRVAVAAWHITQGYIPAQGATVRVRLREPERGFPTRVTGSAGFQPAAAGSETTPRVGNAQAPVTQVGNLRSSQSAFLTIKGPSADGLSRYEFEHEISRDEALHLLALCQGGVVDKTRYLVPAGRHTVEVDEFHALNDGLVIAEIELSAPDEPYQRPAWLAQEVTGQRRYYNSHLLQHPFSQWSAG